MAGTATGTYLSTGYYRVLHMPSWLIENSVAAPYVFLSRVVDPGPYSMAIWLNIRKTDLRSNIILSIGYFRQ